MENQKISVIVPVYKVEPYLRKCLNSIVQQTYRNLEIILVDDGSPDNCGEICDEYAARDSRIKVIHKENGGVSTARNAGLSAAMGEWIGWVDPDDWIEPDMFEYLLENAWAHRADIAVCSRAEVERERKTIRSWEHITVFDTVQGLQKLLQNDMMQNYLWDKLWRRELFQGIEFPVGKTYEDVAVVHRLFMRAKRVVCLPEVKYDYFQRPGSIVANTSLANRWNYYLAAKNRYDEMKAPYPQFEPLLIAQCAASAIGIWCAYCYNPKTDRRSALPQLREIAAFCAPHTAEAAESLGLGLAGRLVLRLLPYPRWWAFRLAQAVSWLYKIKHGRAL